MGLAAQLDLQACCQHSSSSWHLAVWLVWSQLGVLVLVALGLNGCHGALLVLLLLLQAPVIWCVHGYRQQRLGVRHTSVLQLLLGLLLLLGSQQQQQQQPRPQALLLLQHQMSQQHEQQQQQVVLVRLLLLSLAGCPGRVLCAPHNLAPCLAAARPHHQMRQHNQLLHCQAAAAALPVPNPWHHLLLLLHCSHAGVLLLMPPVQQRRQPQQF